MKYIILYTSDNYSEDFIEQYIIVDDNNIQDIIDTLIINGVLELSNEIANKFNTDY